MGRRPRFGAPYFCAGCRFEYRKHKLARLVRNPLPGIIFNEHYEGDGEIVFEHACKLGCEGIVSKRLGSSYRSGRSAHWVKVKNPKARAVRREAEEDWGAMRRGEIAANIAKLPELVRKQLPELLRQHNR